MVKFFSKLLLFFSVSFGVIAMELNRDSELPIIQEKIQFMNEDAKVMLYGTLSLPGEGKFPAILFIPGSGSVCRRNNHRFFKELALRCARMGVASLEFDKRGCGESEGDFLSSTTLDFASDAQAAIRFLAERPEIKREKIGIFGHSEGGLIAAIVGSSDAPINFIMLYGAPGMPLSELGNLRISGLVRGVVEAGYATAQEGKLMGEWFRRVRVEIIPNESLNEEQSHAAAKKITEECFQDFPEEYIVSMAEKLVHSYRTDTSFAWTRCVVKLDPSLYFKKLTMPILLVNGASDLWVPPELNVPKIEEALQLAGNNNVTTVILDKIGHHFNVSEYLGHEHVAEETNEGLITTFVNWLSQRL